MTEKSDRPADSGASDAPKEEAPHIETGSVNAADFENLGSAAAPTGPNRTEGSRIVDRVANDQSFDSNKEGSRTVVRVTNDQSFDSNKAELNKFDRQSLEIQKNRDNTYADILSCYYTYIKTILEKNPGRQNCFFWVSLGILIISPIQFIVLAGVLIYLNKLDSWQILLTSAGEMISAMIIFPKIIAEYLFNTKETTNINDVVTAIQKYDIEIRNGIRRTVENGKDAESK